MQDLTPRVDRVATSLGASYRNFHPLAEGIESAGDGSLRGVDLVPVKLNEE